MSSANDRQVGGNHYRKSIQHWDWAAAAGLDYFQGAITKYIARWKEKNGLQDLEKAAHYLEKYIELVKAGAIPDGKAAKQAAEQTFATAQATFRSAGDGAAGQMPMDKASRVGKSYDAHSMDEMCVCGCSWGVHEGMRCPNGGEFRKK